MQLFNEALGLLKQLITIPSLSKEDDKTADLIQSFFQNKGIWRLYKRQFNKRISSFAVAGPSVNFNIFNR